jgi:hypothetical protein
MLHYESLGNQSEFDGKVFHTTLEGVLDTILSNPQILDGGKGHEIYLYVLKHNPDVPFEKSHYKVYDVSAVQPFDPHKTLVAFSTDVHCIPLCTEVFAPLWNEKAIYYHDHMKKSTTYSKDVLAQVQFMLNNPTDSRLCASLLVSLMTSVYHGFWLRLQHNSDNTKPTHTCLYRYDRRGVLTVFYVTSDMTTFLKDVIQFTNPRYVRAPIVYVEMLKSIVVGDLNRMTIGPFEYCDIRPSDSLILTDKIPLSKLMESDSSVAKWHESKLPRLYDTFRIEYESVSTGTSYTNKVDYDLEPSVVFPKLKAHEPIVFPIKLY